MEKVLRNMLNFLNAGLKSFPKKNTLYLLLDYTAFVTHNAEKYDLPDFKTRLNFYMEQLDIGSSKTEPAFFFLSDMHKFFQEHIEAIVKKNWPAAQALFNHLPGKINLGLKDKGIIIKIHLQDTFHNLEKIDMLKETQLITLALVDLFFDYDVRVDSLRNCENCGKYFFETSKRPKIFCSDSCANAARQKRYRLSRKEET